jgi:predicted transcriptional regulator
MNQRADEVTRHGSGFDTCYVAIMATAAESVKLDDDVHEELRKLAKRSGRPLSALANDALRDFARYENQVAAAIDRGLSDLEAGRTRTTEEVFVLLEQQRLARTRG